MCSKAIGSRTDGFQPFIPVRKRPCCSITQNGVMFYRAAAQRLDDPSRVLLLINEEEKRFAVKAADPDVPFSMPFCALLNRKATAIRWPSKRLLDQLCRVAGWDKAAMGSGYTLEGGYDEENNALIFDLTHAIKTTQRKGRFIREHEKDDPQPRLVP